MTPKAKAVIPDEPVSLDEVKVPAPHFFDVRLARANDDGAEFVRRAAAYLEAMNEVGRIVLLGNMDGTLYLSSVEDVTP